MKLADTDFNFVLDALTGLGSRIAKTEDDEQALFAAMSSVAKTIAEEETSRDLGHQVSPKAFLSSTYARMKSREKVADSSKRLLAKQVFEKSFEEVKDKPVIIPRDRSKSPSSVHMKLFKQQRSQDRHLAQIRQKEVAQRLVREREACTFTPNSKTKATRTPEEFVKHAYQWKEKNQRYRTDELAEVAKLEVKECRDKPQLSTRSQRLAKGKLQESVVKRLFTPRALTPPPAYSFHPSLTVNTKRLIDSRAQSPLISRLYPQTFRAPQAPEAKKRATTPSFKESFDVDLKESYRLNSSRSPMPGIRMELHSIPVERSLLPKFLNV
jgi:hypothetical protein